MSERVPSDLSLPPSGHPWPRPHPDSPTGARIAAPTGPQTYYICLYGHLDAHWSAWFDGMSIRNAPDGTCVLSGRVADQAMLHGILNKIRDLALPLLALTCLGDGEMGEHGEYVTK